MVIKIRMPHQRFHQSQKPHQNQSIRLGYIGTDRHTDTLN